MIFLRERCVISPDFAAKGDDAVESKIQSVRDRVAMLVASGGLSDLKPVEVFTRYYVHSMDRPAKDEVFSSWKEAMGESGCEFIVIVVEDGA